MRWRWRPCPTASSRRRGRASRRRCSAIRSSALATAAWPSRRGTRPAAGGREVRQGSRPSPRQHDGARALSHARSLLLHDRRLSGVRQGIRRSDRAIRGDAAAHNNLALCSTYLRNMPRALEEMRQVVEILPKRALYRVNLALYAAYGGDFQTGEQEARAAEELGSRWGLLALGIRPAGTRTDRSGDRDLPEARKDRRAGASHRRRPASATSRCMRAASPMPCEFSRQGAAADLAAKNPDRAAAKFAALAYAHTPARTERPRPSPPPNERWRTAQRAKIRFLAARVLRRGRRDRAGPSAEPRAWPRSCRPSLRPTPRLSKALSSLQNGDPRQAIKLLTEANALLDTWIGHFDLGRAYLEAGVVHAGRFRIRSVHQAPRRGAVAVPGRGTHLRRLPVRLLLSGPRPGSAEERGIRRIVPHLSQHSREVQRGPAASRSPQARRRVKTNLVSVPESLQDSTAGFSLPRPTRRSRNTP